MSKNFEHVQKILDMSKKFEWKEFEEKGMFKIFEHGQKFFEHVQNFFEHVQNFSTHPNFLNMFKSFWTEQMDRAIVYI